MPRPRSLTHAGIATAALAVIDREGLEALSMRTVARELGVGTMSLYRYVESREELEGLVVDLVLGAVDTEVPARAGWSKKVAILAQRLWDAVAAHPSVVPLVLLTRRHASGSVLRCAEAILAALDEGGFKGRERPIIFRALMSYVFGVIQMEHFGPMSGAGSEALAELPDEDYPFLADTARRARRITPREEFRRGLAVVLRGLEERAPARTKPARERRATGRAARAA